MPDTAQTRDTERPAVAVVGPPTHRQGGVSMHLSRLLPSLQTHAHVTPVEVDGATVPALWRSLRRSGRAARVSAVMHLNPSLRHRALLRDQLLTSRARRHGCRVIWQLHGIDPRLASVLDRSAWPGRLGPDHWVVLHEGVRERVQAWGVPRGRVDVVGPCARAWELPPRDPGGPWLYLGRLVAGKGIRRLLRATERPVVVVGDGPERAALERFAARQGVAARFTGWVDDPSPWLAACAGLVLPSDAEGLPVSVLEALGSGRPVVASAVGGLSHLPGDLLTLVPPGDVDALREALAAVRGVSAAHRQWVRARYRPEAVASQLLAVYEKVMERP